MSSESNFRGLVRRRPVTWLLAAFVVALLAGGAIGQSGSVPKSDLDKASTRNAELEREVGMASRRANYAETRIAELTKARNSAVRRADEAEAEAQRITARGEVPSFQGQTVDGARERSVLDDFDWRITQQSRVSGAEPGTVIAQRPRPGSTLNRGGTINLVVAKKAPPKPKQWVTIYSLTGTGSKRTGEFRIPGDKKVRVKYSYGGDSNDTLQLKTPEEGDDSFGDLIVNEIGPYTGTTRLYGKSGTYYLDVDGGSWNIEVQVFKRP